MADDSTKSSAIKEIRNPRRISIGIPDSPDNGNTILPPVRRASVGSSHVGGNPRRNSAGKPTSQNRGENIIPNYLRASTGSCHDMCKYGRKHANEVKPWKIKPKKAVAFSSEELNTTIVVAGDRKKTTMVKHKLSPDPVEVIKQNNTSVVPEETKKTTMVKLKRSPETSEVIKGNNTTVVSRERKKTNLVKLEPSLDPPKDIKQNKEAVVPRERKKTAMVKLKPSPEPAETFKPSYTTTLVPGERKKAGMRKLKSSPEPPEVIKREILLPSKKVESSSKQDSLSGGKIDRDLRMPAKHLPSLKLKPAVVKPPFSTDASVSANGRRKSDMKTGKKPGPVKSVVKKVLVISTVSLSPKSPLSRVLSLKSRKGRNLKQVSPYKDQSQMPKAKPMQLSDDKDCEKTSQVSLPTDGILQSSPGPQSPPALSPKSSSQGSYSERDDLDYTAYTNSEDDDYYSSGNDESGNPSGIENLQEDDKRATRKDKSSLPEENNEAAAVKLKFRRGRIVDVQSEKNSPRRLRFRRGRVLGGEDDQSGSRRRSYKKKGEDETKYSRVGTEKVVLKHQDVQGKKDSQGLFNNVIEETASKLVETRKSKVQALVGAFETVISLQDTKSSIQTVSPERQFVKHL